MFNRVKEKALLKLKI